MAERLLDLRGLTALCGDPSVHILEALEQLEPGERLRVVAPSEMAEELRRAARSLEGAGIARLVDEGPEDGAYSVVLERRG